MVTSIDMLRVALPAQVKGTQHEDENSKKMLASTENNNYQ